MKYLAKAIIHKKLQRNNKQYSLSVTLFAKRAFCYSEILNTQHSLGYALVDGDGELDGDGDGFVDGLVEGEGDGEGLVFTSTYFSSFSLMSFSSCWSVAVSLLILAIKLSAFIFAAAGVALSQSNAL